MAGPPAVASQQPQVADSAFATGQGTTEANSENPHPLREEPDISDNLSIVLFLSLVFLVTAVAGRFASFYQLFELPLFKASALFFNAHCMNAVTFYGELIDWINHVTERNMFLIQSFAACVSLSWYINPPTAGGLCGVKTNSAFPGFCSDHGRHCAHPSPSS